MRSVRTLSGLLLAAVVLVGCQTAPSPAPPATSPVAVADAVPDCAVESLPPESHEVIEDIEAEHWYYTADHYESFCELVRPPG